MPTKNNIENHLDYIDYIEETQNSYLNVVESADWVTNYDILDGKISFFKKIFLKSLSNHLRFLEKIIGKKLYLESPDYLSLKISSRVKKLINFLFGKKIVLNLFRAPNLPDEPKTIHYYFQLNDLKDSSGKKYQLHGSCGGSGLNSNTALERAAAEAFERHAVAICQKKLIYGSFAQLKNRRAIEPLKFVPFSKKQFSERQNYINEFPLTQETKFGWVEAEGLFDKKKYLAPAQLGYIFYQRLKNEPLLRQTTTNGAAAGDSRSRAVYAAFCEAIERDAFLIHYLNKLSPPRIDLDSIKIPKIIKILKDYKRYNLEVYLLDITSDIKAPTFMAVTIDRTGQGPAVHIATKTDFDVEETIFDILYDGLRIRPQLRPRLTRENFKRVNRLYPNIKSINDRLILWSQKKMIKEIEFIIQGPKKPMPNIQTLKIGFPEKLIKLKDSLRKAGIKEAYFIDATSQEAKQNGIWVAVSLTPELYPLYLDESFKYLGNQRLYQAPVKLGYLKKPKKEEEFNQVPHPMG